MDSSIRPSTSSVIRLSAEETRERIQYIVKNIATLSLTHSFVKITDILATIPEVLSEEEINTVIAYRIPKVSADGSCSLPNNLEPEPFRVLQKCIEHEPFFATQTKKTIPSSNDSLPSSSVIPSRTLTEHEHIKRLYKLRQICLALQKALNGVEWIGIYHRILSPPLLPITTSSSSSSSSNTITHENTPSSSSSETLSSSSSSTPPERLMKLAYVGAPSRPYFPLTPEFASHSNNSTVAMTQSTVIIPDVRKLSDDVPYYQCDATVRSEICVPITYPCTPGRGKEEGEEKNDIPNPPSTTLGIIDIESFTPSIFTDNYINIILYLCYQLSESNLLLP